MLTTVLCTLIITSCLPFECLEDSSAHFRIRISGEWQSPIPRIPFTHPCHLIFWRGQNPCQVSSHGSFCHFFFFLKRERDFEACNFRSNTVAICANWLEPATAVEGQHQDKEVTGVKGVITHLRLHLQFSMISKCDEQCHL